MTTAVPTSVPLPTVAEVRAWLKLTTDQITDTDLTVIYQGEVTNQAKVCRVPQDMADIGHVPPDLAESLYRRCARACAARGLPLGYRSGDGEYGPQALPTYDAEITRLERSWQRFNFG